MMSMQAASEAVDGHLIGESRDFASVSIDSRTLTDGALFFAIHGPNFDGHRFVAAAFEAGAAGVVVERDSQPPAIVVDDTRLALGRLGRAHRRTLKTRLVALTGSNGKTTLKELIGACLSTQASTLSTEGNLNNDFGVPLTLSRLRPEHRFAVIEMGANHAGEIAYLTSLAEPDVVVLNNAGPAHLEGFGSIDGVARAKGEILEGSPRPECAVLNADDRYFEFWCDKASDIDSLSFGLTSAADVSAEAIQLSADGSRFRLRLPDGQVDVRIPLCGEHNVRNACAAAAVAYRLGLGADSIAEGLAGTRAVGGRFRSFAGLRNNRVIDDSYNANPASVTAAAELVAKQFDATLFVLGDMGELGDEAESMHRDCGAAMRDAGIDRLFTLGELAANAADAFGSGATAFARFDELAAALDEVSNTTVIVKGSRSMRMERAVALLRGEAA